MDGRNGAGFEFAGVHHSRNHRDHTACQFRGGTGQQSSRGGSGMKRIRIAALVFLVVVVLASLLAEVIAPSSYEYQFREIPNAGCSRQHLLGTDALGRDRFSRLLFGTRISLQLAPAAALLAVSLAAVIGGAAGYSGGSVQRVLMA